jgi:hypothetical protein
VALSLILERHARSLAYQEQFGDDVIMSIGVMQIQILTPDSVLNISVDVFDMDMPLQIGLDVLDMYRLQVLNIDNVLQHTPVPGPEQSWQIGIRRKNGHVYLNLPVTTGDVFYSELELQKLHRNLYHPSARDL